MTTPSTQSTPDRPLLADFLAEPLLVGEPQEAGNLSVFPLFGPAAIGEYVPFAEARANGARVGELDSGASVNDLLVENPTTDRVLLFEGEEVLGAQQNRTFDVSVLVEAGSKVRVPVSCMEAGRWDGSRHREDFQPAPQTANPRMRRMKARQARPAIAAGHKARANQGAVWEEIDQTRADLSADAPTGAL